MQCTFDLSGKRATSEVVKANNKTVWVRVSCEKEPSGSKLIKVHKVRNNVEVRRLE